MSMAEIRCGDALTELRLIPDKSVRCCVTSPPYWGLRDYGTATWKGGDNPGCSHQEVQPQNRPGRETPGGRGGTFPTTERAYKQECKRCGALRIDAQLGLEPTPGEYVARLVEVFREMRRVLTDDGTLWLNLGDSYAANRTYQVVDSKHVDVGNSKGSSVPAGMKPKDLVGIPWMVAFALRADGWYLRSDVIWAKPNPMPESVTDRPTKSHEYLFLLSKLERYYYDAAAIAEDVAGDPEASRNRWDTKDELIPGQKPQKRTSRSGNTARKPGSARGCPEGSGSNVCGSIPWEGSTRNSRTVWTIATKPYAAAHFATFPEELARRCIVAGSAPGDTVLDPFAGSGTVGQVATGNGRNALLIELNPEYIHLQRQRIGPMFCSSKYPGLSPEEVR